MQKQLRVFTESRQFQIFFIGIILLSGVIVGLDSYPKISAKYGTYYILWIKLFWDSLFLKSASK